MRAPTHYPAWECFFCDGQPFEYRAGSCRRCGVDLRLVPLLTEA